jgi:hypothetical protein
MSSRQIDSKRLRTLTTGRLHTREISYVYEDLGWIIGETGIMTHMLPNMLKAVEGWLRQHVTDPEYWDGAYNADSTGSYMLPEPTAAERDQMKKLYKSLPY